MAIDNNNVIDFLGINDKENEVILTISDHLDWKNKWDHLLKLQAKINAYLDFIESGEIYELNPSAKNKCTIIEITGKFDLPTDIDVSEFCRKIQILLSDLHISIRFKKL